MSETPDDPTPELERVVEAISEGKPVEWEKAAASRKLDPETLEALRLIDTVSRLHRTGGEQADASAGEHERADAGAAGERTWGNLRIRGPLGAGEYGEVYRAFDPGLRKEVALKLWGRTATPRTIEMLLEEARALARVSHPNVLLVLGADVHDGQVGMWTELLEGATLEQLLTELGPGHWREMAVYAIDICRALSAVHAVGLVHRDVKAANVMRERGGRIVLMDFGSAGAYATATGEEKPPSPGAVQGTPLAMAPEVLREKRASPSSDLYSLGVLIFRLVSGRYPVHARTLEELETALAHGPLPSLRSVLPDVPPEFSEAVARALERDPARRFASAVDMERALVAALTAGWLAPSGSPADLPIASVTETRDERLGRRRTLVWAVAATLLAAVLASAWWMSGPLRPTGSGPMQFTFDLPLGEDLPRFANLVISPDGARVAFACVDTTGKSALWVRRFDSLTSMRLPGTEGATYPFWSPDSRQLAFFAGGSVKRVGIEGDSVRVVCSAELGRGGSWGPDGTMLIASPLDGPLYRVPASGGVPVPATTLDSAVAEMSHRWPCFLPDGDHFLYVTTPERKGTFALYVGSLSSDRRVYVGPVESGVAYSSGLLVYLVNEGLEARPFDLRTLRWSGDPRPLSAFPGYGGAPAEPHASVSQNGTLVYAFDATRESRIVWIDLATGTEQAVARGPYFDPVLSPDGRRIAAERVEGSGRSNVWMIDVASGAAERWTDLPGLNRKPAWSPAGDSLLYASNRSGRDALYIRRTDGSLAERLVVPASDRVMMWVTDWPPRGPITITRYDPGTTWNLYELRGGTLMPLVCTPASESRCAVSPDGHWLAYDTSRSGQFHVQIVNLDTREEYVLSTPGGMEPHWARRAGRLYFRTAANDFFEVTPVAGRRPTEWRTRRLFRTAALGGYDVDADGTRLLCCLKSDLSRPEEVAVLVNMPAAAAKGF
jgi:serine/threonine protein kinase